MISIILGVIEIWKGSFLSILLISSANVAISNPVKEDNVIGLPVLISGNLPVLTGFLSIFLRASLMVTTLFEILREDVLNLFFPTSTTFSRISDFKCSIAFLSIVSISS